MRNEEGRVPTRPATAAATQQPNDATVAHRRRGGDLVLTRPGDGIRSRRLRKFAARHLDELLGQVDPWELSEPIDWHATYMDRGIPERDAAGRELAEAGWTP